MDQDIIIEENEYEDSRESQSQSGQSAVSDQSKQALLKHIQATFTLMERSLIELSFFDVPCIDEEDKEVNYRVYFSKTSANFWFQLGFLEFIGLRPLSKTDEQLLLGEALDSEKDIGKILRSNKNYKGNTVSLSTLFYTPESTPIPQLSMPADVKKLPLGDPLALDKFLPNDQMFFQHDYETLEDYLKTKAGPVYYAKGVIKKGLKQIEEAFDLWETGAFKEKCIPSTCLCMRSVVEKNPEFQSVIADLISEVAINSGLYYCTQIDRRENHPTLIYNLAVMLDCSPGLRNSIVGKVKPLIEERLSKENTELFSLEMAVWAKPSFMNALVLYLLAEFNRTDQMYFLALTYLEYSVMIESESKYGLLLADLLEFYYSNQDWTIKQVNYYVKAYKSSFEFASTTALARLMVIYQREFYKTLKDQPHNNELHLSLYKDLKESNEFLEKVCRNESMKFMLDHYLRCLCIATDEKKVITSSKREVENLRLNRIVCLRESVKYIEFFRIMGERSNQLPIYFEVYRMLKYSEAALLALDNYRSAGEDGIWEKSYCYAMCKELGLGVDQSQMDAFKIYMNNFASLTARINKDNYLEAGLCLNRMADIIADKSIEIDRISKTKRNENSENEHQSTLKSQFEGVEQIEEEEKEKADLLRTYALLFALKSSDCEKLTPKFVYLLSQILKKVKCLILHNDINESVQVQKSELKRSVGLRSSEAIRRQSVDRGKASKQLSVERVAISIRPQEMRDDSTKIQVIQSLVRLWKNGIYLPCESNEDFVYLYLIEDEISANLDQFDSLRFIEHRMATDDPDRSDYLSRLKHINFSKPSVDFHHKDKLQAIKDIVETLINLVTDGSTRNIDRYLIGDKIVPILKKFELRYYLATDHYDQSINSVSRVFGVVKNFKLGVDQEKDKLTYDILSKKFCETKLESAKKLEVELFSASRERDRKIAYNLSKVVEIQVLFDFASTFIKKYQNIRLFHLSEIEFDIESNILFNKILDEEVFISKGKIISNNQLCRIFHVEFDKMEKLKAFFDNLFWINTCAPYFLNYYGIMLSISSRSLVVNIISEFFENLVWSRHEGTTERSSKVWTDPAVSIKTKFGLFEDLLLAVQSLHTIGVPHLTVTSGHMVLLKQGSRLKLIIPFFMSYFYEFPSESGLKNYLRFMEYERTEDTAYICPTLFKKYPSRGVILTFEEKFSEKKLEILKRDLWSLGVVLLEILSLRSFKQYSSNGRNLVNPQDACTSMLKSAVKNHPGKDLRDLGIDKMTSSDPKNRLNSTLIMKPITFGLAKHFNYICQWQFKSEKQYILKSYFDSVNIVDIREGESSLVSPLASARQNTRVFLTNNLEFYGHFNSDNLPEGHCIIKQGREPKLDADFKEGMPADHLTLINSHGELARLKFRDNVCTSFELSHALFEHDILDLTSTLVSEYLGPNKLAILDKFKSVDQKKNFSTLMESLDEKTKSYFENLDCRGYLSEEGMSLKNKAKSKRKRTKTANESSYSAHSMDSSDENENDEKLKINMNQKEINFSDKKDLVNTLTQVRFSFSKDFSLEIEEKLVKKDSSKKNIINEQFCCLIDPFGYAYTFAFDDFNKTIFYYKGKQMLLRLQSNQLQVRIFQ